MQLKDLECQLAQSQLTRYLRGAPLSAEALEALEAHISECEHCRSEVAAKRSVLAEEAAPTHVVAHQPVQEAPAAAPQVEALPEEAPQLPIKSAVVLKLLEKLPSNARPIVLSTALALLLITMSAVAKDPTKVFGERLASNNKSVLSGKVERKDPPSAVDIEHKRFTENVKDSAPTAKPAAQPRPTPVQPKAVVAAPAKPAPRVAPRVAKSVSPRRSVASTRTHRPVRKAAPVQTRRAVTRRPAPKPAAKAPTRSSGIVVYDENGNRIN